MPSMITLASTPLFLAAASLSINSTPVESVLKIYVDKNRDFSAFSIASSIEG